MGCAMTDEENEVQEAAADVRTSAVERRAKELAAEWVANDPLEFLYFVGEDSFSATEADLLKRWLINEDEDATARLDESAGIIIRKFVQDYALGRGMRIADSTQGLMDQFFTAKIARL